MGFRKLLEISDKAAREELGDYYIVSESRMNNYLQCLEDGAKQIQQLTTDANVKDMEIAHLHDLLTECGNELFQCGDDGLWITDGHDGGFMRCFCDSINEIIHGVPRSR